MVAMKLLAGVKRFHTLSKKRNATVTATGCIFVSQYKIVVINQQCKIDVITWLTRKKKTFENSLTTKTSTIPAIAGLKVTPVAGILCPLRL